MVAIALTMSAESTLTASSACAACDVTLTASFRSRVVGIVGGLWALDLVLLFYPLLVHMMGETLFQTLLYAWLAYICVMAEVWIIVLCGLAYGRACRMHNADPEYCPKKVLTSLRRKTLIVLTMTAIIYVTLLPWPVCEIIYTDRKLHLLLRPYIQPYLQGLNTKALYDYICVLPYLHLLLQSILVITFPETRWRLCLGQRSAMMSDNKEDGKLPEPEVKDDSEVVEQQKQEPAVELVSVGEEKSKGLQQPEKPQRTSFLQGSLFVENLETLRAHLEPGSGIGVETEDAERLYYNTLPKETTV